MSFPHVINGRWGFEKDTSTTKQHKLGTLMQIEESFFRYVSAGEAITVGQLMESSAIDANHNDDLAVATTASGSVLQSNTTPVGAPVGVTCNDIASASYGWLQVRGPSVCLVQGTPGIGFGLMRSDGTAGALEVVAEASATLYGTLGHMGCTAGVDGEYHEVNLNIS